MTSWLVRQKCLVPRTIPFRKSSAEQARLKSMGDLLATALRPWACLCIGLKDAQTHFLLSSKVAACLPARVHLCIQQKLSQHGQAFGIGVLQPIASCSVCSLWAHPVLISMPARNIASHSTRIACYRTWRAFLLV